MEPTVITGIIQTLGVSTAIVLALGWFCAYRVWPFFVSQRDRELKSQDEARASIVRTVADNAAMTRELVGSMIQLKDGMNLISQSQGQITTTLTDLSRSVAEMNDDMTIVREDIAALYERTGTPRPSGRTKVPTPPRA